jgi:hypothetical protein
LLSPLTRTRCVPLPQQQYQHCHSLHDSDCAVAQASCRLPNTHLPCCLLLTPTPRHPSTASPGAQGWADRLSGCLLWHTTRIPHSSSSRRQAEASSNDGSRRSGVCASCRGQVRVGSGQGQGQQQRTSTGSTGSWCCHRSSKASSFELLKQHTCDKRKQAPVSVQIVRCPSASMLCCAVCCAIGPCSWWSVPQMAWSASAAAAAAAAQVTTQSASPAAAVAAAGLWQGVLQLAAP